MVCSNRKFDKGPSNFLEARSARSCLQRMLLKCLLSSVGPVEPVSNHTFLSLAGARSNGCKRPRLATLCEILDRERSASTAVQDGVPKVPQGEPCHAACLILPATRTHECDVLEISRKPKTRKMAATRFLLSRRTSQTPIEPDPCQTESSHWRATRPYVCTV